MEVLELIVVEWDRILTLSNFLQNSGTAAGSTNGCV